MVDENDRGWTALSCVTLQEFTNKKISIYLSDSRKRVGWVFAIDPVTHSIVPVGEYSENSALLSVMGVLLVEPPYGPDCCRCSNEIVLDCVQKLIKAKQGHDK